MEWVEITAKTVHVAKESALDQLGVDHDEAEFVVVEEPRKGLFGQTRGSARVRARVIPRTPPAKVDRRSRRGKSSRPSSGEAGKGEESKSSKKSKTNGGDRRKKSESKKDAATARKSEGTSKPDRRTERGNGRDSDNSKKEEGTTMAMSLDEQTKAAETFLSGLLQEMAVDGQIVTTRTDDANAQVNIEGDDLGLLIGPGGTTMNALQDLTRVALQKQAAGSWEGHVHVDVNGYREQRRTALVRFVQKVADQVIDSEKPKALEPMASADRKVVHDTVNEIAGVHTSSEGHEPKRWVMIVPGDA